MTDGFPVVTDSGLLLRHIDSADQENIYRGLSHPGVIRYYGVRFDSLEATAEQMEWYTSIEENKTGIWLAICSAADQRFYGACGLNHINLIHHKAEIGYWLLREYWGQGIIMDALPVICRYGFATLGLHRIEAIVETENEASKRVLEKLNFTNEGTMRDSEWKEGRYISLALYSLLRNELSGS